MNIEILNNHGIADDTVGLIISVLESAFGRDFKVTKIIHIGGGIAKTTFKIAVKNHGIFLLQVWQEPKLGLTSINGSDVELLWHGGLKQVIKNTIFLESIGVRVPHIIASDIPNSDAPGIAISEYIDGSPFIEMNKDKIPDSTYSKIGDLVGRVHSCTSSKSGIIGKTNKTAFDCLELVRSVALKEFLIACEHDPNVKETQTQLLETLAFLQSQASDRKTYNLVHGDGLQMIISKHHEPVLIDIDAMQYFDLEYDYCIMDFPHVNLLSSPAFIDSYHKLICPNCEYFRLKYYRICKLISWLSYFSEALYKTGNTRLESSYKNTRQWLNNTLKEVEKEQKKSLTRAIRRTPVPKIKYNYGY